MLHQSPRAAPQLSVVKLRKPRKSDTISQIILLKWIKRHRSSQDPTVCQIANSARLFTPIPKRVMNGSEEGDVLPAAVLSGAPIELQARTVR